MRESTMVILVKSITWLPFILTVSRVICDNRCHPGLYGERCDKRCNDNCRSHNDGNIYCEKHSGTCLLGCAAGWYNEKCTIPCSKNCIADVCNQQTGQCTSGCTGNYRGAMCDVYEVNPPQVSDAAKEHIMWFSIAAAVVILIAGAVIIKFAEPSFSRLCDANSGGSNARSPDADEGSQHNHLTSDPNKTPASTIQADGKTWGGENHLVKGTGEYELFALQKEKVFDCLVKQNADVGEWTSTVETYTVGQQ